MFRWFTAGESHGAGLFGLLEGIPAGLKLNIGFINDQLQRRQAGYGRGARMKIEQDRVRVVAGMRKGLTIGSPLALFIENKDHKIDQLPPVTAPRPGHADLAGYLKYGLEDIRSVLERASARETAMRVAIGGICRLVLKEFGIGIFSHIVELGGVKAEAEGVKIQDILIRAERSPVRCVDKKAEKRMISRIKKAIADKDTIGGTFEVIAVGVLPGLGSYAQWDERLDARLAAAIMSIPAVKGVEIGLGFRMQGLPGSQVHDPIYYKKPMGFYRKTDRCGGIEGGISNGEPIMLRAVMKPIATLGKPLASVDIRSKKSVRAAKERSDVCAVPSAAVIGEAMVGIELCRALLEKFGGDQVKATKAAYHHYVKLLSNQ